MPVEQLARTQVSRSAAIGQQGDDAVGFGDVVGVDVGGDEAGLGQSARGGGDVVGRAGRVDGEHRRLLDFVVVAADRIAVRSEHVEFAARFGPGEDVARVGVLGDQPQSLFLSGAADH
jgi:hypothetical protein